MLTTLEAQVHREIETHADTFIALLRRLVQTPSITGNEGPCQKLVRDAMQELGLFDREVFGSNDPPFHATGRSYVDRPSVVGVLRGDGSRHFVLNAHIDTAPVENPESWKYPPFDAVVEDGRMYGRGALDDKAGVAMMMLVADSLRRAGVKLPGNLYLESVIEDEDSGNGTLACTQAGYTCDAAIILDGTWPFRCVDAHLGQLWLRFDITGQPVAACSHKRGVNPIDIAMRMAETLKQFIAQRNRAAGAWQNIDDPYFVSIGHIRGGAWPGAVPEAATIDVQMGFPQPATADEMLTAVRALIAEDAESSRIHMTSRELSINPFANRDNRMVQMVRETVSRLRAGEMEFLSVPVTGHCDLRHVRRADGSIADACLYGPGGGVNPHVRDEYYHVDHFVPVAQNIASAIMSWYSMK